MKAANIIFTCFFALTLLACQEESVAYPPDKKLKKQIERIAEDAFVPSLSLRISSPGHTLTLDYHHPEAAQQQVYGIGSTTKMLAAVLFFYHLENGDIELDDKLEELLDDNMLPNLAWKEVRLSQLLRHNSGIADYTKHPDWIKGVMEGKAAQSFQEKLALVSPERNNEGSFSYSNTHYLLLEKVIEALRGKSYQEAFNEFYAANDLSGVSLKEPEGLKGFFAQQEKQISDVSQWREYYGYDGGAYATAESMQFFMEKLFVEKSLISEESLKQMQEWISMEPTTIPVGEGRIHQYGYGLMSLKFEGQQWIGHAGGTLKYQSFVFYQPETQTSISLLTNCSGQYYNRVFYNKLLPLILDAQRGEAK